MSYKRIEYAHGADEDDDGDIMLQPLHNNAASEPPSITVTTSSMSTFTPAPDGSIAMGDDPSPSIVSSSPGERVVVQSASSSCKPTVFFFCILLITFFRLKYALTETHLLLCWVLNISH